MRSHLPLFAILALAAAPAEAATRNFGVSGYDRVRVEGPYKVRIRTGIAPFARANGPDGALDQVSVSVQGRTLVVKTNTSSWGGYPGQARGAVLVEIGTHELEAAWLNGSGSVEIDRVKGLDFDLSVQGSGSARIGQAEVDQLKIGVQGSGSATLGGAAASMNAVVRGVSVLDAATLAVKDARIGADGSVTVKANVSNSAKIDAQGTATVTLAGRPSCTVKASGSASVDGCR